MTEKARENVLKPDGITSVLEFVTNDEAEADRISELWPSQWPRTIEKSTTLITIRLTGSLPEVQERSIFFLDKLKEAGLPRSQKVVTTRIEKGAGGDAMSDQHDDESDDETE